MNRRRLAGVWFVLCLLTRISTATAADDATMFRLFLKDGTSLVSYGEVARVGDRVVFSMPTSTSTVAPELQLIDLAADRIDWERTNAYADAVRARQYLANQAVYDYAQLSNDVARALND